MSGSRIFDQRRVFYSSKFSLCQPRVPEMLQHVTRPGHVRTEETGLLFEGAQLPGPGESIRQLAGKVCGGIVLPHLIRQTKPPLADEAGISGIRGFISVSGLTADLLFLWQQLFSFRQHIGWGWFALLNS